MKPTMNLFRTLSLASLAFTAVLALPAAHAQFSRTGPEWTTAGMDAQRSRSVPGDEQISLDEMKKPGFAFLWKQTFANKQAGLRSLSEPVEVNTFISYRGFKALSVVGGTNALFAVDYDLGVPYWEKRFDVPPGTPVCAAGVAAAPGRLTPLVPPPVTGSGSHGGYHSSVSKPGVGVDLSQVSRVPAARPTTPPAAPAPNVPGIGGASGPGGAVAAAPITGPVRTGPPPGTGLYKGSQPIFAVSSDGVLHGLSQGSAKEILKPMPFVPAGTGVYDLIDVEDFIYAATVPGCGSGSDSVYAMDVSGPDKTAVSWKSTGGRILGAPAFTTTGTVVVVTPQAIFELEPKTLKLAHTIASQGNAFASAAVILTVQGKEMIAVTTADGHIVLHPAKEDATLPSIVAEAKKPFAPNLLTTWEDAAGTRWLLAADSEQQSGAIQSYRLSVEGGKPVLRAAWASAVMDAPGASMVINGVVFALATGEYRGTGGIAEKVKRSRPAVVYALDAATGQELWNSGKSMTSFVGSSALSFSPGQIYVATYDNTLYAFGFPQPRQ